MPYLHPESLSPDPLYGQDAPAVGERQVEAVVYPFALVRAEAAAGPWRQWRRRLDIHADPGPVELTARRDRPIELLIDFGTELDGAVELALRVEGPGTVVIGFGESVPEAAGLGLPSTCHEQRPAQEHWRIESAGLAETRLAPRGFRYLRLVLPDHARAELVRLRVRAELTFRQRLGDLRCSDRRFQRIWQSSVYTARVCSRPDTIWDGPKRDRVGWYGDAYVCQLANDAVWLDPVPAERMLLEFPTREFANAIPLWSFAGISLLRHLVLTHGADRPAWAEIYPRIREFLRWVRQGQTDDLGLLIRRDDVQYFFGIGFLDWSPQPLGGRFEELSWLQATWAEALQDAADVARWLGHADDAADWADHAARLRPLIRRRFWQEGAGFAHTLNQASTDPWRHPTQPGVHHRLSYLENVRLGPSGPSRVSNARVVLAGAADEAQRRTVREQVFDSDLPGTITSHFVYFEQAARAQCGDATGAIRHVRDYFGAMLIENDSATVWESFEPGVQGFAKYGLHGWPKSLCHGWGAGAVPLAQRYLLGVEAVEPGFARVSLRPTACPTWRFTATVPTPHGPIMAQRDTARGPVRYRLPDGVEPAEVGDGAVVQ